MIGSKRGLRLLLIAVLLISSGWGSQWAFAQPPDQSDEINVRGDIPSEQILSSAVIKRPTTGQRFNEPTIEVAGLCTAEAIISIYRNHLFAGSAFCLTN